MRPETLVKIMDRQELLQKDVGFLTGVTERQVRHWVSGKSRIPRSAGLLLKAVDNNLVNINWILTEITKQPE